MSSQLPTFWAERRSPYGLCHGYRARNTDYEVRARACPVSPDATPPPTTMAGRGGEPCGCEDWEERGQSAALSLKINDDTSSVTWLLGHLTYDIPDRRVSLSSSSSIGEGWEGG